MAEIEESVLEGRKLSSDQAERALKAIDSNEVREQLIGAVAILCSRDSDAKQKSIAREKFEKICQGRLGPNNELEAEVLFMLLQIPIQELVANPVFRALAYKGVDSDRISVRGNSILVLERLGVEGDARALLLIRNALTDTDEKVRTNAMIALQKI